MENIAPYGDANLSLPLELWPQMLGDARTRLVIDRRYYGHAARTDRWACRDLCHDQHMIYLVFSGHITGQADGHPFDLEPGTLFWLNPWTRLDMTWPDRLVFTEVWFRVIHRGRDVRLPESHVAVRDAERAAELFHRVEEELTVDPTLAEQSLKHWLALLTIEVTRLRQRTGAGGLTALNTVQQRRLLDYIRQHLGRRPTLMELAGVADLSPDYFTRVFRQTFGVPPRDLMIRERIREAARLLSNTNLTVDQVADRLGYANVSQFSRQFRQHTGRPPRRYRLSR